MRLLLITLMVSLAMWAAPARAAAFPALAGIEADNLRFDTKLVPHDDDSPMAQLTSAQIRALMPKFVYESYEANSSDEDFVINICLAGVTRLSGGHTMLVFLTEEGDAMSLSIGVYDSDGELTDYAQCGEAVESLAVYADEAETRGTEYAGTEEFVISDDRATVTVKRVYGKFDFVEDNEGNRNYGRTHWEQRFDYVYRVDGRGELTLTLPRRDRQDGDPVLLSDIVADLNYLSVNQPDAIDVVQARLLTDNGPDTEDALQAVLIGTYTANPERLLYWLAGHRDSNAQVLKVFESVYSDDLLPKYNLYKTIESLPAGDARDYLMQVTAQWGPSGAEG